MRIQSEDTKNISFLDRKRINQKDDLFQATLIAQSDGTANCQFYYDREAIYNNVRLDPSLISSELVLDIFVLGKPARHVLPKDGDLASFEIKDIPDGARPELRLKIVASDDENIGRIYAATAKKISFKSISSDDDGDAGTTSKAFLKFEPSDQLGGKLIEVEWQASRSDLCIRIDKKLYQEYQHKPLFSAMVFPDLLRSVSLNLLLRMEEVAELDETSSAYHWLRFIEDNLGCPLFGVDRICDLDNRDEIPDAIEQIVQKFMSKQWRNGKTFKEEFLNAN